MAQDGDSDDRSKRDLRLVELRKKIRAAIDSHNRGMRYDNPITALLDEVYEFAEVAGRKRNALRGVLIQALGREAGLELHAAVFDHGMSDRVAEALRSARCDFTAREILKMEGLVHEALAILREIEGPREAELQRWIEEERPRQLEQREVEGFLRKRGITRLRGAREVFDAALKARIITDLEHELGRRRYADSWFSAD